MTWHPPNAVGDSDPKIVLAKQYLRRFSYGKAANDGTPIYTAAFGEALKTFQAKRNDEIDHGTKPGPRIDLPARAGWFDYATKVQLDIEPHPGGANPPPAHIATNTHALSAPGSGADWWMGPPFNMCEWLKDNLGVHHWPCGYPKGGYLGLMGGSSAQSYIDTIALEDVEVERRIREDVLASYGIRLAPGQPVTADVVAKLPRDFKLLLAGYSQSADGIIRSAARLFGDGGVFELLRPFLVGIVAFGNPARQGGPTRYGRNPKGKGISQWIAPSWLARLIIDIVTETPTAPDFYACNTSQIAHIAYQVVINAETELPFLVYLAKLVIPALLGLLSGGLLSGGGGGGGLLGGLLGGLGGLSGGLGGLLGMTGAVPLLSSVTGMSGTALTPLVAAAQTGSDDSAEAVSAEIAQKLTLAGIVTSIPELIGLLMALPGIQTHGGYEEPKPEFGGLTGVQVALNQVRPLIAA